MLPCAKAIQAAASAIATAPNGAGSLGVRSRFEPLKGFADLGCVATWSPHPEGRSGRWGLMPTGLLLHRPVLSLAMGSEACQRESWATRVARAAGLKAGAA